MPSNLVVIAYRDGRRLKGTTYDFIPTKRKFHIEAAERKVLEVCVDDLKAIFFVKDLEGDWLREKRSGFPEDAPKIGRRVEVVFPDGEVMHGSTQGYSPLRTGFFLNPADAQSNNQRVFVFGDAVKSLNWL